MAMPVFAQNKSMNNWCFGYGEGLDFSSYPPKLFKSASQTAEGTTCISDGNGKLLFYYSNNTVYDRNHQPMPNGSLSAGSMECQNSLIVPIPESRTKFYVFSFVDSKLFYALRYSIVDMSLNGGLGDVVESNILIDTGLLAGIAATHHANGYDLWLVVCSEKQKAYLSFKITAKGIEQAIAGTENKMLNQTYAKFSPDGKSFASLSFPYLNVFHFDPSTGILSENFKIETPNYAFSFSADGSKLYNNWEGELEQYDVKTKAKTIMKTPDFTTLQYASDGRIYMTGELETGLWVINNPNLPLDQAGVVPLGIHFSTFFYHFPNFIESIGQAKTFSFSGSCQYSAVFFELNHPEDIQSVIWDFGDGKTSTEMAPRHVFETAGDFKVTAKLTYSDNTTSEVSNQVTIKPQPQKLVLKTTNN